MNFLRRFVPTLYSVNGSRRMMSLLESREKEMQERIDDLEKRYGWYGIVHLPEFNINHLKVGDIIHTRVLMPVDGKQYTVLKPHVIDDLYIETQHGWDSTGDNEYMKITELHPETFEKIGEPIKIGGYGGVAQIAWHNRPVFDKEKGKITGMRSTFFGQEPYVWRLSNG